VREQIVAAVIGTDETETLRFVEPLDRTGIHACFLDANE
jgi:hypothetical protein